VRGNTLSHRNPQDCLVGELGMRAARSLAFPQPGSTMGKIRLKMSMKEELRDLWRDYPYHLTRPKCDQIREVACPKCGAEPYRYCKRQFGKDLKHSKRNDFLMAERTLPAMMRASCSGRPAGLSRLISAGASAARATVTALVSLSVRPCARPRRRRLLRYLILSPCPMTALRPGGRACRCSSSSWL